MLRRIDLPRLSCLPLLLSTAGALVVIAGCGGENTVNTDDAEALIRKNLQRQLGADVSSVACPDDVKAEKGRTFTCEATGGDGTKAKLDVVQTDDEGGIRFEAPLLHTGPAEELIEEGLAKQIGANVSVKCPDLVLARRGTKLTCRATSGDDKADVDVTVEDEQGTIRWELKQ
jgi:hypothetical protein